MAKEFIIKKGLSTSLFDEQGNCKIAQSALVENGWYLTTDTAEVYVALRQADGLLYPKKINECDAELDLESFDNRLTALENEDKLHTYGYRAGFPTEGIEGHMYVAADEQKTYIWYKNEYLLVGGGDSSYEEPDVIYGGSAD